MALEDVNGTANTERAEEDSRLKQYKNIAKHEVCVCLEDFC